MPVAIELFLDESSADVIRTIWREISEAEVSPYLHTSGVRPHLTLAVGNSVDGPAVENVLRSWAASISPRRVTFTSLGVTSSELANAFLTPTVTTDLLDLHAELHRRILGLVESPWERYLPGHWTPHCTLVERVPGELIGRTLEICRRARLPLEANLAEVGLVDFSPLRQRCALPLTG